MISDAKRVPDLTIVGDVMPGRNVASSLRRVGLDAAAERLRCLLPGRVVIGNLECALSDSPPVSQSKPDGAPYLYAATAAAAWLRQAGFAAVSLANNHVMDCGRQGLLQTIESLHRQGIATAGAGRNLAEAVRPVTVDSGAKRIALLAFGNGPAARRKSCGVAPFSSDALAAGLSRLPPSADAVVVMVHAGIEFLEYPESYLRQFAAEALEGGADIVVGSHPHCIRGLERTSRGMIFYGLGDFLADTADGQVLARHLARTAIARLGFGPTGARYCREALVCDVFVDGVRSIECRLRSVVAASDFLPRSATEKEHDEIVARLSSLSRPIGQPASAEMGRAAEIERAYRKAFGRGRTLKDYLTLPFRLRPRHADFLMQRLARAVGVGGKRT
ncbi:MAG: CapA family protein [Planctomycetota bacterium]